MAAVEFQWKVARSVRPWINEEQQRGSPLSSSQNPWHIPVLWMCPALTWSKTSHR